MLLLRKQIVLELKLKNNNEVTIHFSRTFIRW